MSDIVQYHHVDSAAVITLNRPEKRNALSRVLVAALMSAFDQAANDPAVRSVILTGNGPVFCAGMDLEELRASIRNTDESGMVWDDAHKLSELYERIYSLPKPTIAAVNGAAVAGGAGLMTVCDLAICVPDAKLGYPEVRRGLVAAMVLPHLLRHVGERIARYLLLSGTLISADTAMQYGLINEVAERESLLESAMDYCRQFAQCGPKALAATKELLRRLSHQAMPVEELAKASSEPRLTEECRSGLEAFFGNRPAPWTYG